MSGMGAVSGIGVVSGMGAEQEWEKEQKKEWEQDSLRSVTGRVDFTLFNPKLLI